MTQDQYGRIVHACHRHPLSTASDSGIGANGMILVWPDGCRRSFRLDRVKTEDGRWHEARMMHAPS